jgi:translation elongation factor EF-G
VPRLVFINKCDRVGANPFRVLAQARDKLKLNAAAVQVGLDGNTGAEHGREDGGGQAQGSVMWFVI